MERETKRERKVSSPVRNGTYSLPLYPFYILGITPPIVALGTRFSSLVLLLDSNHSLHFSPRNAIPTRLVSAQVFLLSSSFLVFNYLCNRERATPRYNALYDPYLTASLSY